MVLISDLLGPCVGSSSLQADISPDISEVVYRWAKQSPDEARRSSIFRPKRFRHALRGALIAVCAFGATLSGVHSARAEAWIFGVGINDFTELETKDRAIGSVEYQTDPVTRIWGADMSLAVAATVHASRDVWAGAGLAALYPLRNRWFVEGSVMPGIYFHEQPSTDIGSRFEIRTLLGMGRQINDKTALSVAITHKSNAGTSDVNPGVNALLVRLRYEF